MNTPDINEELGYMPLFPYHSTVSATTMYNPIKSRGKVRSSRKEKAARRAANKRAKQARRKNRK